MARIHVGTPGIPLACKGKDTLQGIICVRKLGLDAMEIQFVRGIKMTEKKALECRQVAMREKVLLSVHAPYWINLLSDKQETVEKSKERIEKSCRIGKIAGAYICTVHPAYYGKLSREEAKKKLIQALNDIDAEIPIGIETMGKQTQFGPLEDVVEVVRETGQRIVVDWAHLHARYGGRFKTVDDYRSVLGLIEKELGREALKELHQHWTQVKYKVHAEGVGNEVKHLKWEEGDMNFRDLAQALIDYDVEGCIICESPVLEDDALKMKAILKELGISAD